MQTLLVNAKNVPAALQIAAQKQATASVRLAPALTASANLKRSRPYGRLQLFRVVLLHSSLKQELVKYTAGNYI